MLIPISIPFERLYYVYTFMTFLALDSLRLADCYLACGAGEYGGMDIGIKLLSCYTV